MDFKKVLADVPLPAAIVDLDAVERNADRLLAAISGGSTTIRLASKSVRVPAVLKLIASRSERFRGIMAFSAHEAALLAQHGFDDILVAYPVARPDEAAVLAELNRAGKRVIAVIDDPAHIQLLSATGAEIPVCIDVDASWKPIGQLHLGVRRSPIRDAEAAVALATRTRGTKLTVVALMAYEAQVAGLPDTVAGQRGLDPVRRWIKAKSQPQVADRRRSVVAALRAEGFPIEIVNGGGTGSIAVTSADGTCTEVTAGSGLFASHLFDGYRGIVLEPAAFFAIAVVRRSDPDFVTCAGGGIIASGPPAADRLPRVQYPDNLAPIGLEGFGEVQTPFKVTRGEAPRIGDPVVCRPAKAGEWLERFNDVLIVRGDRVVERAKTYRGLGAAFF